MSGMARPRVRMKANAISTKISTNPIVGAAICTAKGRRGDRRTVEGQRAMRESEHDDVADDPQDEGRFGRRDGQ